MKILKSQMNLKKHAVLSMSLLSVLAVGSARAADAPPKVVAPAVQKEASQSENQLFARLLGSVVNNIQEIGQFGVNINGRITKSGTFEGETKVSGMIQFLNDIEMTLDSGEPVANPSGSTTTQNIMASLIPKIQLKLKGLFANVGYSDSNGSEMLKVDFFGGYDKSQKKWIAKPLVAGIYNKMNKGLSLSLSSVEVTGKSDAQNADRQLISGKCKVEHRIYDFTVDKQVMKPVRCEFSGVRYKNGSFQIDRLIYSDQQ
jgi:hypothetical protein